MENKRGAKVRYNLNISSRLRQWIRRPMVTSKAWKLHLDWATHNRKGRSHTVKLLEWFSLKQLMPFG
ncbi:hypothetical protein H5410_061865 [Solanum commersonii]|uniref:Uncharacterized protein n=1 Tax=Solanum commersonii TaxID=4109 RepID=A0A9J5W8W0_SOLCO|nr:hypothetical protein H5410_061865 [Solanum commersonii]